MECEKNSFRTCASPDCALLFVESTIRLTATSVRACVAAWLAGWTAGHLVKPQRCPHTGTTTHTLARLVQMGFFARFLLNLLLLLLFPPVFRVNDLPHQDNGHSIARRPLDSSDSNCFGANTLASQLASCLAKCLATRKWPNQFAGRQVCVFGPFELAVNCANFPRLGFLASSLARAHLLSLLSLAGRENLHACSGSVRARES